MERRAAVLERPDAGRRSRRARDPESVRTQAAREQGLRTAGVDELVSPRTGANVQEQRGSSGRSMSTKRARERTGHRAAARSRTFTPRPPAHPRKTLGGMNRFVPSLRYGDLPTCDRQPSREDAQTRLPALDALHRPLLARPLRPRPPVRIAVILGQQERQDVDARPRSFARELAGVRVSSPNR